MLLFHIRVMEKGHTKCAQYWPKRNDKTITYGNFAVLNKKHNMIEQFLETELVLYNLTVIEFILWVFGSCSDYQLLGGALLDRVTGTVSNPSCVTLSDSIASPRILPPLNSYVLRRIPGSLLLFLWMRAMYWMT